MTLWRFDRQREITVLILCLAAFTGCPAEDQKALSTPVAEGSTAQENEESQEVVSPAKQVVANLRVKQRSTTDVPGFMPPVRLTVDDITGGQVIISIADDNGRALLSPQSLTPGKSARFALDERDYDVTLSRLENSLVGDDFATVAIAVAAPSSKVQRSEAEKIEELIRYVASLKGATFVRNGTEYSAQKAADHLRMKVENAGADAMTATQFIDEIASKSSISGQDYEIRLQDGSRRPAGQMLRECLKTIEDEETRSREVTNPDEVTLPD